MAEAGHWLTPEHVQAHVAGAADPAQLLPYTIAARAYVQTRRPELDYASDATVPGDVRLGACLLAARLYARRGTMLGLANYGEAGPAQILRTDPDIARLVGIGVHASPQVG